MKREVTKEEGEKHAKKNGFGFYETSACNGEGIDEVFRNLA